MAIKEFNVDLDIKGKVSVTNVPNSTGSIVTWNTDSKVFGLRTDAQIISDLNLSSSFVPYTGATANVNLGSKSITSTGGFIGNASTATTATTATTLATARTIAISGGATGTATSFNGSANIAIAVTSLDATKLTAGTIPDARLSGVYTGFTHRIDGTNTLFTTPSTGSSSTAARTVFGLAEFRSSTSATIGAIVFIAPFTKASSIMKSIEIDGMLYSPSNAVRVIINNYTGGLTRKMSYGTVDIQVRVGETVDGKFCVILGDVDTSWSYPHLTISKAMFSHSSVADSHCYGWTTALVTDLTGYTNISVEVANAPLVIDITGNAATATKLATTRTINGTSFNGSANITTANWGAARTLTIGNTGKSVNGSGNVSWSLAEIGAASSTSLNDYVPYTGANQSVDLNTQNITHRGIVSNVDSITSPWLRHGSSLSTNNKVAYLIIDGFTADTNRQLYIEVESVSGNGEYKRLVKGFNVNFTNTNTLTSVNSSYLEVTGNETHVRYGIGDIEKHSDTALKIPLIWLTSSAQSINKISVKAHTGSVSGLTFSTENDATSTLTTENPYLYRNASEKWVKDSYDFRAYGLGTEAVVNSGLLENINESGFYAFSTNQQGFTFPRAMIMKRGSQNYGLIFSNSGNKVGFLTADGSVYTAWHSGNLLQSSIDNWNTAFGWGDHTLAGYLTSFTETDPVYTASIPNQMMLKGQIYSDSDLNDYKDTGIFVCPANGTAATILNSPTVIGFKLEVVKHNSSLVYQKLQVQTTGKIYTRSLRTSWTSWKETANTDDLNNYIPTTHVVNTITSTNISNWNNKQDTISGGATTIVTSNLTANRALVSDALGKVAVSTVTSTQLGYLSGVTSAIQTQLNDKINSSLIGANNGVASLGSDGKINSNQLPPLAITETFPVSTQAQMLALTAQQGDVAIRSDINKTFILRQEPASAIANWSEMLMPASGVQSVAMSVPTGFSISGSPITSTGTLALGYASGYQGFTTAQSTKLAGIATGANNYTLPIATATVPGGIELFSNTEQSVAANAVSTTASRTYGVQLNSAGQAVVNVPWTDTVYSASTGLSLSETAFSVKYGTAAGTAAQGNDSRINNGQTAFGWGDFRQFGLGLTESIYLDTISEVGSGFYWSNNTTEDAPFHYASIISAGYGSGLGRYNMLFLGNASNNIIHRRVRDGNVYDMELWHNSNLPNPATETWVNQQINNISIPTVNNGQLTLSTGTGLTGSATFTANQAGGSTFSVAVASTHKLPTTTEWNALSTQTLSSSTSNIISGNTVQRAALTGDVTALQNSNATTIATSAVTHAKYQNIATQRILGRGAAGSGNVQELTLGDNLTLSAAGVLNADYGVETLANLKTGASTTGLLQSAKNLNDWGDSKYFKTQVGSSTDMDLEYRNGTGQWSNTTANTPHAGDYGTWMNIVSTDGDHNNSSNWINQFMFPTTGNRIFFRNKVNNSSWQPRVELWHSGNLANGAVTDITTNSTNSNAVAVWSGKVLKDAINSIFDSSASISGFVKTSGITDMSNFQMAASGNNILEFTGPNYINIGNQTNINGVNIKTSYGSISMLDDLAEMSQNSHTFLSSAGSNTLLSSSGTTNVSGTTIAKVTSPTTTITGSTNLYLASGSGNKVRLNGSNFTPAANNGTALGTSSLKWSNVFATKVNDLVLNYKNVTASNLANIHTFLFDSTSNSGVAISRAESNLWNPADLSSIMMVQYGATMSWKTGDTLGGISVNPFSPEVYVWGRSHDSSAWSRRMAFTVNSVSITATAFYESSLREFKENIVPLEKSGLDLVNSLEIVRFDRKSDGEKEGIKNKIGVIADDTDEEFLSEEKNSVDIYKTLFIQAKAIQELSKENEELRGRVTKLEELIHKLLGE